MAGQPLMDIEFDPAKDDVNRAKHGVSLSGALRLDWSSVVAGPDVRGDYGEPRMIGYGLIADRLYCVVFVPRANKCRVISLRKANRREVTRYAKNQ